MIFSSWLVIIFRLQYFIVTLHLYYAMARSVCLPRLFSCLIINKRKNLQVGNHDARKTNMLRRPTQNIQEFSFRCSQWNNDNFVIGWACKRKFNALWLMLYSLPVVFTVNMSPVGNSIRYRMYLVLPTGELR